MILASRNASCWLAVASCLLWVLAAPVVALDWAQHNGYRSAPVTPAASEKTGFSALSPQQTGLTFTNVIPPERHYTNQIYLNGSGVAAGDVDGDGWCDLLFAGLAGRSTLYRNLGNWQFRDVTVDAGLGKPLRDSRFDATGVALADLDGDNDLDLVVNSVGQGTLCLWNDGKGRFPEQPLMLNEGRCGSSLALADIDGDGALDLYITNYRISTIRDQPGAAFSFKNVNGKPEAVAFGGRPLSLSDLTNRFTFVYVPRPGGAAGGSVFHDELGEPDALFRNQGGRRLAPVDAAVLPEQPLDWGLSIMLRDFNGDGAPDIYVCNDFSTPDRFWINDGKGRFRGAPKEAIRQTSLSTMAIDVADINRDGFDDIFTADMLSRERWRRLVQRNEANPNIHLFVDVVRQPQTPRNTLQLARGDGTYAEVAQLAGLEAAEWAWSSIFLDVDLDGYEDLLVANGFERDFMNMDAHRKVTALQARAGRQAPTSELLKFNRFYPRLATANAAFRNLGDLRFADVSTAWGFDQQEVSQGMCLADLDNDGDLDVAINNSNNAATLLRNNATASRIAVRLKGEAPNTRGVGARMKVLGGAVPVQAQEMIAGGRYLSSDDPMRVFATGKPGGELLVEVTWRNGTGSIVSNLVPNRIYEIDESGGRGITGLAPSSAATMFKDASALVNHTHSQESFDDFSRQPLLPNKLSTLGPGISWYDVNSDGWDDLIIAGSKGGRMAVYQNTGGAGFAPAGQSVPADRPLSRGQTTILGHHRTLIAGSSSYEDGATNAAVAQVYRIGSSSSDSDAFPGSNASTGPLALADLDGDGNVDLFVGGRCIPGRWPEAAPSLIFRQADGQWALDRENTKRLAPVGLVSGAVFTDIDNDADSDLVLACEWGPPRVFRNERGTFVEATTELGLSGYTGWWNGVTAGDFDGDGRMDLILSNWGRNTKYERFRAKPLQIAYGDFSGDGGIALMEAVHDERVKNHAPILNVWTMSRSMPWLLEKFGSYEAFARATMQQALAGRPSTSAVHHLEVAWLDSTVFLNRGAKFEARPLPLEAQFAPTFGVCVADFDGDGHEDAFLSQNFFAVRAETSRYDAGRGVLLRGDGHGGFAAVPGHKSGLLIYGEQRGAAVADYDGDGRTDLAVTQVGAETKLYRNETAGPGLRVRLRGKNIGAIVRLKSGEKLGPAREIHAGSGYWSQDSAVQVMTTPQRPGAIRVRWPGGKTVEAAIPRDAAEISIDLSGNVERVR